MTGLSPESTRTAVRGPSPPPGPSSPRPGDRSALSAWSIRHLGDLLGLAFLVVLIVVYLSPAFADGVNFGPADVGRGASYLTRLLHPALVHNSANGDTITQGVPWNTLDWQLVHHGQLPLWNSLSGTGLPQLFNFESAPFSLATMAGYLVPLSMSLLVTVAVKMLVAGTGAYLACRVLGAGPVAATFGGATFMLSGAFSGWLGWSVDGPTAWAGWIVAAIVLAYHSRRQVRQVLLLAVTVAFSVYAGFPESSILLAIGLGVLLVVTATVTLVLRRGPRALGVARVGIGVVAGGLLTAPLLLPGASTLRQSARAGTDAATGIPLHLSTLFFAQGYFGLPTNGSYFFGPSNYYESAAYVGVLAIVLSAVAVALSWRRPVVVGLAAAIVVGLLIVYRLGSGAPVQTAIDHLGLGTVAVQRMQSVLELSVAVLAGLGLDLVIGRWRTRSLRVALSVASLAVVAVLAEMWRKVDMARLSPTAKATKLLPTIARLESIRRASLIWPTVTIAGVALAVVAASAFRHFGDRRAKRAGRTAALIAIGAQAAFLVAAGVGINSYSHDADPVTPAVTTLQRIVGTGLLGLDAGNVDCKGTQTVARYCGVRAWRGVGFYPVINILYDVDELALHDPTIPQAYFDSWPVPDADQHAHTANVFVPAVDSAALARRYGVVYVLVGRGVRRPTGMRFVTRVAGERLFAVPDSARFSFLGAASRGAGRARVVSSSHPSDNRYEVKVDDGERTATLAVHLTDVPGWHATVDGRSVPIRPGAGDGMSIVVPAGSRTIELRYWPGRLTAGLALAAGVLIAFGVWAALGIPALRRRTPLIHGRPVPAAP